MIKSLTEKHVFYLGIIVIVIILAVIFSFMTLRFFSDEDSWICFEGQWVKHGNPSSSAPNESCGEVIIGGDKDEHGCLIAAGYSWNDTKKACVREWEEKGKIYCDSKSREGNVCTMEYNPVCGYFNSSIQCIKYPCADTYGNSCGACHDSKVEYYVLGECSK